MSAGDAAHIIERLTAHLQSVPKWTVNLSQLNKENVSAATGLQHFKVSEFSFLSCHMLLQLFATSWDMSSHELKSNLQCKSV